MSYFLNCALYNNATSLETSWNVRKIRCVVNKIEIKHWLFVEGAVGVKSLLSLTSNPFWRFDSVGNRMLWQKSVEIKLPVCTHACTHTHTRSPLGRVAGLVYLNLSLLITAIWGRVRPSHFSMCVVTYICHLSISIGYDWTYRRE